MVRTILAILIIVVLVAIAAVATGYVDISTKGQFRAPAVAVTGGEVPTVDVDTKRIVVEGHNRTVEVPEVGTTTTNVEVPVVRTEEQRR